MHPIDRRHSPRFPFHGTAHLIAGARCLEVRLLDLSFTGALLDTADQTDEAPADALRLLIPRAGESMLLHARRARREGTLVALRFTVLGERERGALRQLVEMNLGTTRLLRRDLPALLQAFGEPANAPMIGPR